MDQLQTDETKDPIGDRKAIIDMTEQEFRDLVVRLFQMGETRMNELQERINENTDLTRAATASTAELVEIFKGAKTGAAVFSWLGRNIRKVAQFIYPFVLLGGAVGAILHGKWPKLGD